MAYSEDMLFDKAIELLKSDNEIVFIYDIIVELGISSSTFYDYFPDKSAKSNEIKDLIIKNRGQQKKKLRKKWYDSDNATLNICAYKLLSDDEERKLLADKTEVGIGSDLSADVIKALANSIKAD